MDIVEVLLTLKGRDVPSRAYITIGAKHTYSPTWTGNPAILAYAMACGITTAAAINPANKSNRNQLLWYFGNQSNMGMYFAKPRG
jgi:hypothetical protein